MTYYNENDAFAARWLRNLADAGEITDGRIDTPDIAAIAAIQEQGLVL